VSADRADLASALAERNALIASLEAADFRPEAARAIAAEVRSDPDAAAVAGWYGPVSRAGGAVQVWVRQPGTPRRPRPEQTSTGVMRSGGRL
jgi:hypothetical protein